MLYKLAFRNVKKSLGDYTIYFLTLMLSVIVFYAFNSIEAQKAMMKVNQSAYDSMEMVSMMISYISVFVSFVLGFLVIYANGFLMKRRKKELGIYLTLGMSKGKLSFIFVLETLLVGIFSLGVGLILGILLSQGMSVITASMFEVDLRNYQFIFSLDSLVKTIVYFGVIFILVMIFNVFVISKQKLINAKRQISRPKVKHPAVGFFLLILGVALVGVAYFLVTTIGIMVSYATGMLLVEIILGAAGTYAFFAGAGKLAQLYSGRRKKRYYKDLNLFVSRQFTGKIHTTHVMMATICLLLFFTMTILSSSYALGEAINNSYGTYAGYDISFLQSDATKEKTPDDILSGLKKTGIPTDEYFAGTAALRKYTSDIEITSIVKGNQVYTDEMMKGMFFEAVGVSQFNQLLKLCGQQPIELSENQVAFDCNIPELTDSLKQYVADHKTIDSTGKKFGLYPDVLNVTTQISMSNMDFIIVYPDNVAESFKPSHDILNVKYPDGANALSIEDKMKATFFDKQSNLPFSYDYSKAVIYGQAIGLKGAVIFVGIYLGIIFLITCAAILALQQLSEAADNKQRYAILSKMGADGRMINRALLKQIVMYFVCPLLPAIVHSIVGIKVCNDMVKMFGEADIWMNVIPMVLILVIVYGGYFVATYFGSRKIIKEDV